MRRGRREPVYTRSDQAAHDARRAGKATLLQRMIVLSTQYATTSLSEIAQCAGISDSTLSSWRRGARVPTPEALEVLADVLAERGRTLVQEAELLMEDAERLRTPAGRAWLLCDGALRSELERRNLCSSFERALEKRLEDQPDADPTNETEALAQEMIRAADAEASG